MRRPDDASLLVDILISARDARAMASDATLDDLLDDLKLQLALVKLIEIIGEAASRLSSDTRQAIPDVPWDKMIGMRHRLVHDYGRIDYEVIWRVVQDDIPRLLAALESHVPPEETDA